MNSIFQKNAADFESDEETEIDFREHLKDLSISKEIIRGSKLRDQKLKSAPLHGSYNEFNIEFTKPKCSYHSHRTEHKNKKQSKRIQQSRSSSRSVPFPNFSLEFGRKSTTPTIVIPDSTQKQKQEKLGCPMRIVELAVPSKRLCIDTWREKKGVLPAYMVERLKKLVLDQKPVVEINDALRCFKRKTIAGKRQGNKIKPKSKTANDMRYTLMMCTVIANKLIKDYSVPFHVNMSEEHSKIANIVRKEIKSMMSVHKTKLSKNKEREILSDVSNRIALWIAIVQEQASYNILEEELRELEEEEGPVLDILDYIFDHSMDLCIPKPSTPPPDLDSDDGDDFESLSEHSIKVDEHIEEETNEHNEEINEHREEINEHKEEINEQKEETTEQADELNEKEPAHDEGQDYGKSFLHETSAFVDKGDLQIVDSVSGTHADPQNNVSQNEPTSGVEGHEVESPDNYTSEEKSVLDERIQDENEQTPEHISEEKGGEETITEVSDEPLLDANDLPTNNNYEDSENKTENIDQDEDTPVSNTTIDSPNEHLKSEIDTENGKEQYRGLDKESLPKASLEEITKTDSFPNPNLEAELNGDSSNSNRLKRKRENDERIKFSIPNEHVPSNVNIGPLNENLLSAADESWPEDVENSSLKLTDVVSKSVTSLGRIHEAEIDDDNISEKPEEIVGKSSDVTADSIIITRNILDESHPEGIIKKVIQYGEEHDTKRAETNDTGSTEIKPTEEIIIEKGESDSMQNPIEETKATILSEDAVKSVKVSGTDNIRKSSEVTKTVNKDAIKPVTDIVKPIINEIMNEVVIDNKRNSKDIKKIFPTRATEKTTKSTITKNDKNHRKQAKTKSASKTNASQPLKDSKNAMNKKPKTTFEVKKVHNVKYKPKQNLKKPKLKKQKEGTLKDSDPLVTEIKDLVANEEMISGCQGTRTEICALDSLDQETKFDYRVDIGKAPSWVKKVFDKDYQNKAIPITKQSEIRQWCKDIETLADNMEKWIEWRDIITENIIDMKRNEIRSYYSASKRTSETDYKNLEEWLNLYNDVDSDAMLWTRLFRRTQNKLEKRIKKNCC